MPISRSKPPATYVPYSYMTLRGGTVGTSIRIIDANGNTMDISGTDGLLLMMLKELTAMRVMLNKMSDTEISGEEM